jgi:hypothetical protein
MINILSLGCGLAFAPYIIEAASTYFSGAGQVARVVRQGGSGLIISSQGDLSLRFQNRESRLDPQAARHYLATVGLRSEFYDVARLSDEVVIASLGPSLLLSHPQSDLWLDAEAVFRLLAAFDEDPGPAAAAQGVPDWLSLSVAAGRLLISDQRNGRWVLLGSDHKSEMKRRLAFIEAASSPPAQPKPPVIQLKTLSIHLQSAFKLAASLAAFAQSGEVTPYEEIAPAYTLRVTKSAEGIDLADSNARLALTRKEANKWAAIIESELARLNAAQAERGQMRTVFADGSGGRWVLQWGDEILLPDETAARIQALQGQPAHHAADPLVIKSEGEFLLLLAKAGGSCVALTESEKEMLLRANDR